MQLNTNTPTKWEQFRAIIGLPGHIRVKDVENQIPNERLAMFFFGETARVRGEAVETEMERAQFGCPTPRNNTQLEA